jgi:uncharacterized protein (TIGR03000 family)
MQTATLAAVVGAVLWAAPADDRAAAPPDSRPATIVVSLPADARLTVDGQPTTSTTALRRFVTPPLPAGRDFEYTFRAEIVRGDLTLAMTRKVTVRAGQQTDVRMELPAAPVIYRGYPLADLAPRTNPQVAPMSEQDPLNGKGPPGSNDPLSLGMPGR